jgi:spore cortex biosynthesis protein YabQ
MEISLYGQLYEVAAALLLGVGMGFVYDCMRIVRGRLPLRFVTALLDILFWIVCAAMAFWFAMTFGGGELQIFSLGAMALGIVVYFLLLSVFIRAAGFAVIDGAAELIRVIFIPLKLIGKKIHIFLTKLFPFVRRWHILREEHKIAELRNRETKRGAKEKELAGKAGHTGIRGVVGGDAYNAAGANQQTKSRKRGAGGKSGGAAAAGGNPSGGYRF